MRPAKLLARLERGQLANVRFEDFRRLVERCGFRFDRVAGSHHVYLHDALARRLVLQPLRNGDAKHYQIRQFLEIVRRYPEQTKERL